MTGDRTLNVNVRGEIYGCRAVIPVMLSRGGGSIVNIASVNMTGRVVSAGGGMTAQ